jgi:hypothetical protein
MTEVHVQVTLYMTFSQWVSVCVEPLCWVQYQVLAVLNSYNLALTVRI